MTEMGDVNMRGYTRCVFGIFDIWPRLTLPCKHFTSSTSNSVGNWPRAVFLFQKRKFNVRTPWESATQSSSRYIDNHSARFFTAQSASYSKAMEMNHGFYCHPVFECALEIESSSYKTRSLAYKPRYDTATGAAKDLVPCYFQYRLSLRSVRWLNITL